MKRFEKLFIRLCVMSLMIASVLSFSVHDIYAIEKDKGANIVKTVRSDVDVEIESKEDLYTCVVEEKEVVTVEQVNETLEKRSVEEAKKKAEEAKKKKAVTKKKNKKEQAIEKIKSACRKYGVNSDIALAIARLETGHFKSNAFKNKNNVGGLSRNEKPMSFDSLDDGVEAFVRNLKKNYFDKGLNTPEKIGKKYCPVNPEWASLVRSLM